VDTLHWLGKLVAKYFDSLLLTSMYHIRGHYYMSNQEW